MSSFSGGAAWFVDGMYISDEGDAFVGVYPSDVGFEQDCGIWTKIS